MNSPIASQPDRAPEYYVVAPHKFNLLYYSTLGIYPVYWSHRQWRAQKAAHGLDVWPMPRGLFLVFFMHSLLRGAAATLQRAGRAFDGDAEALATRIVALVILANVADRLAYKEIGSPYTDLAGFLLLPFIGAAFVKAQRNLNLAAGDPEGAGNRELSGANIAWMLVGGLLWCFALFGLYAAIFDPALLR